MSMDLKSEQLRTWNQCGDTELVLDVPDACSLSRQQVLERLNTLVWEKKLWLSEREDFTFQMSNLKHELRRVKMLVADREGKMVAEQAKHQESTERYERTIACLKSGFQLQLEAEKVKYCEQQSEISNLEEQHGKISLLQQLLQNKVRDFEHQLSEKDNNIVNLRKNNDALCWDLEAAKQELLRYYAFLHDKFNGELSAEENHWLLPANQTTRRSNPPKKEATPTDSRDGGCEEAKVEKSSNQSESEDENKEEEEEENVDEEEKEVEEDKEEWTEKQKKRKEKEERCRLKKREKQERKLQKQAEKEAKKERKRKQKLKKKESRKQQKREENKQQQQPAGFWRFVLGRRRRQEQQDGDMAG